MKYSLITAVALSLVLITSVSAGTVVRTGDQVSVTNEQNVADNFYAIGNSVVISGESSQDLTMIGGKARSDGAVAGDVLAAGVSVLIDGVVSGDVRVLGGDVTISGEVLGDVVVVGGVVEVLSTASIGGDLLAYVGTLTVGGSVAGDVLGRMDQLTINSVVVGNLNVAVSQLTLGEQAVIEQTVRYTSDNLLIQAFNTTIGGDTVRNDPVSMNDPQQFQSLLMLSLMVLLACFVWYLLSRPTLNQTVLHTVKSLLRSAIVGFVSLLVLPLIIAILAFSYIGIYVAVICLVGYVTLLLLAIAALPAVVGRLVMDIANKPAHGLTPLVLLVGSTVCSIILLFPAIGPLILLFGIVFVFGGLVESIIKASR